MLYNDVYKSSHKTLDRYPLNDVDLTEKGIHLYRKLQAEIKHFQRLKQVDKENLDYYNVGLIVHKGFVGSSVDVERALKEFENFEVSVSKNSNNILSMNRDKSRLLYNISLLIYPHIYKLIGGDEREVETKFRNNTFAQIVRNRPGDDDHQKLMHLDTYFPAIKFWWFPKKVDDGPLMFAKGSTKSNEKMQMWYYQQSVKACKKEYEEWRAKDHYEGSFRVSEEELQEMGYEMEPIYVNEDTLVIANVGGFHSRGNTKELNRRFAIHGSVRLDNPLGDTIYVKDILKSLSR